LSAIAGKTIKADSFLDRQTLRRPKERKYPVIPEEDSDEEEVAPPHDMRRKSEGTFYM
jgi:hypothetical protein